jgi:hypothetical protein
LDPNGGLSAHRSAKKLESYLPSPPLPVTQIYPRKPSTLDPARISSQLSLTALRRRSRVTGHVEGYVEDVGLKSFAADEKADAVEFFAAAEVALLVEDIVKKILARGEPPRIIA